MKRLYYGIIHGGQDHPRQVRVTFNNKLNKVSISHPLFQRFRISYKAIREMFQHIESVQNNTGLTEQQKSDKI